MQTQTFPVYRPGEHRIVVVVELTGFTTIGELQQIASKELERGDLLWFADQWFRWTGSKFKTHRKRVSRMVQEMIEA